MAKPFSRRLCHTPPEIRTIARPTGPDFAAGGSANFEKRNVIFQPLRTIRARRTLAFAGPLLFRPRVAGIDMDQRSKRRAPMSPGYSASSTLSGA
jgi:hypothetical protein